MAAYIQCRLEVVLYVEGVCVMVFQKWSVCGFNLPTIACDSHDLFITELLVGSLVFIRAVVDLEGEWSRLPWQRKCCGPLSLSVYLLP